MRLTPQHAREAVLRDAGVPQVFLRTLSGATAPADLQLVLGERADDAFERVATSYTILEQHVVTPLLDCRGSVVVLLERGGARRFVHFELEVDEVYDDFGSDFRNVIAWLLIAYYELTECSRDAFLRAGDSLGSTFAGPLFDELERASRDGTRATFAADDAWRRHVIPKLLADASDR